MDKTEYVLIRKRTIPLAAAHASAIAGPRPTAKGKDKCGETKRTQWGSEWNRAFHEKMTELVNAKLEELERRKTP